MNAFNAVMIDAYRELNSRKLFWITLILSGVVVLAFVAVGINPEGVSIFGRTLELPGFNSTTMSEEVFFKLMFVNFGLGIWLTWIATVLALASTAGMFPDLMSGGAIDMVLSKPIRRRTLFIYKYLAGLLFTGLQVLVFTGLAFLVIGFKSGAWEPGLFLAVPLVVVFYSYLFAFCVLLGVLTRSTVAALLLTLLFWFVVFIVNAVDGVMLQLDNMIDYRRERAVASVEREERLYAALETRAAERPDDERTAGRLTASSERLESFQEAIEKTDEDADELELWKNLTFGVKTVLPKTGETIGLLNRWLVDFADLAGSGDEAEGDGEPEPLFDEDGEPIPGALLDPNRFDQDAQRTVQLKMEEDIRARSVWWILGTSLGFEAILLLIAGWRFSRRDF